MIRHKIASYTGWLQRDNYKSFYLALLRVAICCWLLKEVVLNLPSMNILYGPDGFVVVKPNFLHRLPGGIAFAKHHYAWFIGAYVASILLFIAGIGRWLTAIIVFTMINIVQNMNMSIVNGGDMMARLIVFYLIFANSYQYFVLFKEKRPGVQEQQFTNLLSNLAAFSIMLHLCIAYFSSGMLKLMDPYWWRGEALYYAFQMERFIGTPLNRYITQYPLLSVAGTYAALAFEILFPVLIWFKKLRKPLLVIGILFHLSIYIFMMIYAFQVVFVLIYGLFVPHETWLQIMQRYFPWLLRRKPAIRSSPAITGEKINS